MKTYLPNADGADRKWTIVDAEGQVLGRLASQVASRLRGKHRTDFTPHLDTGDFVVVVNAAKIRVTGAKMDNKIYYRYSGYPGGLKETNLRVMLEKKPEEVIFHAVKGMLPKNRLGRKMLKKLRVYGGAEHPHAAQQPEQLEL